MNKIIGCLKGYKTILIQLGLQYSVNYVSWVFENSRIEIAPIKDNEIIPVDYLHLEIIRDFYE